MRLPLFLLLLTLSTNASPTIRNVDWRPACDGANIEVVSDQAKILSVSTSAVHSALIVQWTIHYMDGIPVTAEFREYDRGRILEGEKAGEYSEINKLKRLETFKWKESGFSVPDKTLNDELSGILAKIRGEQNAAGDSKKPSN